MRLGRTTVSEARARGPDPGVRPTFPGAGCRRGVQARGHSQARRNRRKAAAWLENRGGARNGVSNAESWTTSRRSNESNDRGNKSKRARGTASLSFKSGGEVFNNNINRFY